MTISDGAKPQLRTTAANRARAQKAEQKWAERLRGRGWAVVPPELAGALKAPGAGHSGADHCEWCRGYTAALGDVLGDAGPVDGACE